MVKRKKKVGSVWIECYAYTIDEAKNKGIQWRPLRDKVYSEYVETDNGYVVRCISKKEYPFRKGTQMYIKTEFGSIFERSKLLILPEGTLKYSEYRMKKALKKKNMPLVVDYVVACMLSGSGINPDSVVRLLGIKHKNPKVIWNKMMSSVEVRGMIQKSLQERLEEMNVNEQKVIDVIDTAIEIGKQKKNPFALLKAAELMGKYLGMDSKTVVKESHSTDGNGNISKILKEISIEG